MPKGHHKGSSSSSLSSKRAGSSAGPGSGSGSRGGLSRADREHLLEFGYLHPVVNAASSSSSSSPSAGSDGLGKGKGKGKGKGLSGGVSHDDLDELVDNKRVKVIQDESMLELERRKQMRGKRRRGKYDVGGRFGGAGADTGRPGEIAGSGVRGGDENDDDDDDDDDDDEEKESAYDMLLGSLSLKGKTALLLKRRRLEERGEEDADADNDSDDEEQENHDAEVDGEDTALADDDDEEEEEGEGVDDDHELDDDGEEQDEQVGDEDYNDEEIDDDDDDDDKDEEEEGDNNDLSSSSSDDDDNGYDEDVGARKHRQSKAARQPDSFSTHFKQALTPQQVEQLTSRKLLRVSQLRENKETGSVEIETSDGETLLVEKQSAENLTSTALLECMKAVDSYQDVVYSVCDELRFASSLSKPVPAASSLNAADPAGLRALAPAFPAKPAATAATQHQHMLNHVCKHVVAHIKRVRARVLKNSQRISAAHAEGKDPGERRDQGFTRPRVLFLCPFRNSALKVVKCLLAHFEEKAGGGMEVASKKRFYSEYGVEEGEDKYNADRPADFNATFEGNIDDHFKFGIKVTRKIIRLFADFYSSDILIASPVALKRSIGEEGDKVRDYDFLSSIEIVVGDQMDVFFMQNWDHMLKTFQHLNLLPQKTHDTDYSRVREWSLDGWAKFYRQTILLSAYDSTELKALVKRYCYNIGPARHSPATPFAVLFSQPDGSRRLVTAPSYDGVVSKIVSPVPQMFHRFECDSFVKLADARFEYFTTKVLPTLRDANRSHTAIFVPSYFDFVRVRNYFKREEIDFIQISEYSANQKISRARTDFFHGNAPLLLFTERFYFFRRYRIRGIRSVVFYDIPHNTQFYPEIVNVVDTSGSFGSATENSIMAIYSKLDADRLERLVGTARCERMISSDKPTHMFC